VNSQAGWISHEEIIYGRWIPLLATAPQNDETASPAAISDASQDNGGSCSIGGGGAGAGVEAGVFSGEPVRYAKEK